MFGICNEHNNLIGVCGLVHIDWKNRSGEYSIYIGDEKNRGKGYARETDCLVFNYGFKELGLHKMWVEIYDNVERVVAIRLKQGFVEEGILRDTYWYDGRWWNSHILSLLDSYE